MHSSSRTVAAQIALAAAFGGALAWKTMRLRQQESEPRANRVPPRVRVARESPGGRPGPAGGDSGEVLSRIDLVPWPALGMLALGTAAVVVVIVAFVIAVAGSHERGGTQARAAPTAAPVATAVPARTPTLAEQLQDARRELDLASVAGALDAYATFFGKYPSTGGSVQTLCAQPSDAGCTINRYSTNLPLSDGTQPYWYASDGRTYTLLAHVAVPPAEDRCPADLRQALRDASVFCLNGGVANP